MKILVPDCSANRCGKIHTRTKISLPPEGNMNKCYDEPAAPTSGKMNLVYEMVSQINDVKKKYPSTTIAETIQNSCLI